MMRVGTPTISWKVKSVGAKAMEVWVKGTGGGRKHGSWGLLSYSSVLWRCGIMAHHRRGGRVLCCPVLMKD